MSWLKGFLEQNTDLIAPFVPSAEINYPCGSERDNPLVPAVSQACPTEASSASLLVDSGSVGHVFEGLGQNLEEVLSHLKPWAYLGFVPVWASGTDGASLFDDARFLWEERAAILEHEAGFPRAEAEARALVEVRWVNTISDFVSLMHMSDPRALSPE